MSVCVPQGESYSIAMRPAHTTLSLLPILASLALGAGCDGPDAPPEGASLGSDIEDCELDDECMDDDGDAGDQTNALAPDNSAAYIPVLPAHRLEGAKTPGQSVPIWSGVQLQNLGNEATTLSLTLYDRDGTVRNTLTEANVQPGASANFITHLHQPGWSGHAIGSAANGAPVEATINLNDGTRDSWDTSTAGDSYEATTDADGEWALPYLDLSDRSRTALWVMNPTDEAAALSLAFPGGRTADLGTLAAGQSRGIYLPETLAGAGLHLNDVTSSFASATKKVGSAVLTADRVSGAGRVEVAVAVTAIEAETTMTAYTPARFGDNLAPLVNFQPAIGLDTVVYAQRLEGAFAGEDDDLLSVHYRFRDADGGQHQCSEHVFGVEPKDVVDFGWSFSGRESGARNGYHRTSDCPELRDGLEIAVGWASASPNAAVVVTQGYSEGSQSRRSAYAGAWQGAAASEVLSFALVQTDNPAPASDHANWSGISVVNPNANKVTIDCKFYNSDPDASELDKVRTRAGIEIGAFESVDMQMYNIWNGTRFYGSAECTSEGGPIMGLANQQYGWSGAPMSYRGVAGNKGSCSSGAAQLTCGSDGFLYNDSAAANGCLRPTDSCASAIDAEALDDLAARTTCRDVAMRAAACIAITDPNNPIVTDLESQCQAERNGTVGECALATLAMHGCQTQDSLDVCINQYDPSSQCFDERQVAGAVCGQP